jgi:ring-1,2-phenylacetyl-CoA epoxidase subunit PaaD
MPTHYTNEQVTDWLQAVKDPEIPVLSLVDLGVITDIDCSEVDKVAVTITPTFSGCPAIDHMQEEVISVLKAQGVPNPTITVSYATPWSSDRISPQGLASLKAFGLALPGSSLAVDDLDLLEQATCPFCDSSQTVMKSMFGPTQCRSLHYCDNCKQAFERFKPL